LLPIINCVPKNQKGEKGYEICLNYEGGGNLMGVNEMKYCCNKIRRIYLKEIMAFSLPFQHLSRKSG